MTDPMDKSRGSAAMLHDRGITLEKEELRKLVDALRGSHYKVVDWHIYGQPAPDALKGALHVPVDQLPIAIKELFGLSSKVWVDIFPLGTPVPDVFHVTFGTPNMPRG